MGIKCGKQKYLEEDEKGISLKPKKSLVGKCRECHRPNTNKHQKVGWCHSCNTFRFKNDFYNWSSGNDAVDYFIQETQLNAKSHGDVLEWIPYESIDSVDYIAKGGYGTVFSATWKDGYITHWDKKTKRWARSGSMIVTVKSIDNSANMTGEFFHEDPQTQDYMIVSEYANNGNLRSFLVQNNRKLNWERRLRILLKIAMALQDLHQAGFVHKDLHSGNILQVDECIKISDFGESNQASLPQVDLEQLRTPSMAVSGPIYTELLRKHYRADKIFYDESQNVCIGKAMIACMPTSDTDKDNQMLSCKNIDDDSENLQAISPDISEVASTRYSEILSAELAHGTSLGVERSASRYSLALVAEIQRRLTPKLPEEYITTQSQLRKGKYTEYLEGQEQDQYSIKTNFNDARKIRGNSVNSPTDYSGLGANKYNKYNNYQIRKVDVVQNYLDSTNKYQNQIMGNMQNESTDEMANFNIEDSDMLQYICKQPIVQRGSYWVF
ncbi:2685_t:CDS:2, partial [Acaulospora colombiana]